MIRRCLPDLMTTTHTANMFNNSDPIRLNMTRGATKTLFVVVRRAPASGRLIDGDEKRFRLSVITAWEWLDTQHKPQKQPERRRIQTRLWLHSSLHWVLWKENWLQVHDEVTHNRWQCFELIIGFRESRIGAGALLAHLSSSSIHSQTDGMLDGPDFLPFPKKAGSTRPELFTVCKCVGCEGVRRWRKKKLRKKIAVSFPGEEMLCKLEHTAQ